MFSPRNGPGEIPDEHPRKRRIRISWFLHNRNCKTCMSFLKLDRPSFTGAPSCKIGKRLYVAYKKSLGTP